MILFKDGQQLQKHLKTLRKAGKTLGFVPTMGALHQGHISLLNKAKEQSDITICSIFVNPTQFNDPADFKKYPITIEKDIYLLESEGTDILFLPSVEDLYPSGTKELEHYDLGPLETILEGKYRPGHFQGVCQVMQRLLNIVEPQLLFMGQKDYQQCMVVKKLLTLLSLPIQFVTCPTMREKDGLAMSSRNMRLDSEQRKRAIGIFKSLDYIRENARTGDLRQILRHANTILSDHGFVPDYLVIADSVSLKEISDWNETPRAIALAAAFLGDVRLIDNMLLQR